MKNFDKTKKILEFDKILSSVALLAATDGAKKSILNTIPSTDAFTVLRLQKETTDAKDLSVKKGRPPFGGAKDITEALDRAKKEAILSPRELLDIAIEQNPNLKLVILEPFFLPVGRYIEHYHDFMKVFVRKQAIIKKIAEDYGAIFIPIQKRLEALVEESAPILKANGCDTDPNAYWLWDGVHPTEAMQGLIAELWIKATNDLLA